MILILTACGCLALRGSTLSAAETPALSDADQKALSVAAKVKSLDELCAQGERVAESLVKPTESLLKDESPKVRAHAALALGAMGSKANDSVTALAELLKDPDDTVRRSAVRAIQAIHPGPAVMIPICTKLLEDPDPAIRTRILTAIAERGGEAVPPLIEALKDDRAAYWALLILRDIGPEAKDAIPAIAGKLQDKKPEIRREAALTLGAMGEAAVSVVPQIAALLSDEHAAPAATFVLGELQQIPKEAEATIRANAENKDLMLSTVSLWALARVHPEDKELRIKTTETLVARLKDKDQFVRVAAARALAALPPAPEITAPIWEKAMQDADETTIRLAMDAMAALGVQAVPRLTAALKYEKFRVDVVYALGRIGPAAAPAAGELAKLVDDKNSRVAHEAIIALGEIGPGAKDAVPALAKGLDQEKDLDLNFAAIAFALGNIGPAAAAAEPALLRQLESKDDNVRLLCAWALARIEPAKADVAAKAVPVLVDGLALPLVQDRLLSAEALGGFGPLAASAADALKKAAAEENKDVQAAAAKALKAVETPSAAAPSVPMTPLTSAARWPQPGDFAVTVEDKVEIGVKGEQGDVVAKGTKLKVLEIRGSWIGVRIDGKTKAGWVRGDQIARP
jgi:HEAT repeat protein